MATLAAVVTVTASATLLSVPETDFVGRSSYAVFVPTGGATVYVGPAGVTSASGFPVTAGNTFAIDLDKGEVLYGVTTSGSQAVNVFRQGV